MTYAASYAPYGEVLASAGEGESVYGYTGEAADVTGLVYLRARYYSPWEGRFLTRDTWGGNQYIPASYGSWLYTYNNPINYVDPSGYITERESTEAAKIVNELKTYSVMVKVDWGYYQPIFRMRDRDCAWAEGEWSLDELGILRRGVTEFAYAMGGAQRFIRSLGPVNVMQTYIGGHGGLGGAHSVKLTNSGLFTTWTVVHELAHSWDADYGWGLSAALMQLTGGYYDIEKRNKLIDSGVGDLDYSYITSSYDYTKDITLWRSGEHGRLPGCNRSGYFFGGKPMGSNWNFNHREDFAESVVMYIFLNSLNLHDIAQGKISRWHPELTTEASKNNPERNSPFFSQYSTLFYSGNYSLTTRYQFIKLLMKNGHR